MSGKISGEVWDLDLKGSKQLVLLAMADHADHIGENIYPSVGLIAWKTSLSERQVRRVIKALLSDKILLVQTIRPGKTTIYKTNFSAAKQKPPFRENVTPDIAMSPLTPDVTPTPDIQMSAEPSLEPSLKDSPSGALPIEKKKEKAPNPMYDAILSIWGYTAGRNGKLAKMLQGLSSDKGYKEFNVEPGVSPDELLSWRDWYKHKFPGRDIVEELIKIQSSIGQYRLSKRASTDLPKLDYTPVYPEDLPVAQFTNPNGIYGVPVR